MGKEILFLSLSGYIGLVIINFNIGDIMGDKNSNSKFMGEFRLPGDIVPQRYELEIIVDLDEPSPSFTGNVSIKVHCLKSTDTITLYSSGLTISIAEVYLKEDPSANSPSLAIKEQTFLPETEFYNIILEESLATNKFYFLYIPFSGNLTTGLVGLYRSRYVDNVSGNIKWMASTHFEPVYARKAFPCFDEPSMRANFKIKIGHKEIYKSLSNMPLKESYPMSDKNGWIWSDYEESPLMSTYLVAYAVGDIAYKESDTKPNGVVFRVWARKDVLDQMDFAKQFGPNVLEYYEHYFDNKYPLPKLDMIAIPDFSIGAMENWGLITYRETTLLYNEKASSVRDQQQIASTIAHEISHQWFGNLVTVKWWTDLWLKEGFATYLGNLGVHKLLPQWDYLDETVLSSLVNVYNLDSLESSHPVSVEICNASEVAQIFDSISYYKGAIIIRMMNNFLGKSLQPGLNDYLNAHKYSSAEQDDLWAALTNRAHKEGTLDNHLTVKKIMDTWTLQTGYPLVTVKRNYDTGTVNISQRRYYLRNPVNGGTGQNIWWIPLTYTTLSENNFNDVTVKHWFNKKSDVINISATTEDWIIFNVQATGLYRVNYDTKNWEMIIATLNSDNFKLISSLNRANLLLDIFDLTWKGEVEYSLALEMVKYLRNETKYIALAFGLEQLDKIRNLLVRTSIYSCFENYIRDLISPIYDRYDNLLDNKGDRRIHALITEWACLFGIEKCCNQALDLFKQWQNSTEPDKSNPIPTDVRRSVYSTAISNGDSDTWDFLWERYLSTQYASEKDTILRSLACSEDVWILNRYLEWSISDNSGIRRHDSPTVFASIANQRFGAEVAIKFFQQRINDIVKYHSQKTEMVNVYLTSCAGYFIHHEEIEKWKEFVEKKMELLKGASLGAKQSIDIAYSQKEWINDHYSKISQLLSSQ